jgi:hypothetical protein
MYTVPVEVNPVPWPDFTLTKTSDDELPTHAPDAPCFIRFDFPGPLLFHSSISGLPRMATRPTNQPPVHLKAKCEMPSSDRTSEAFLIVSELDYDICTGTCVLRT